MKFINLKTTSGKTISISKFKTSNKLTFRLNRVAVKLNCTQAIRIAKALVRGAEKVRGL